MNAIDPSHGLATPGVDEEFLQSLFARIDAGDATKPSELLRQMLDALSKLDDSTLQKLKSKYGELAGRGSKFDYDTGRRMQTLALKTERGVTNDGTRKPQFVLGNGPSDNILEIAYLLLMAAVSAGNQDAQTIMEEVKELGQAAKPRRPRPLLWAGASVVVILLLGFFGFRIVAPKNSPGPPDGNPGPPEINPGPPDSACSLHFLDPLRADGVPASGPFKFQWTSVPQAASYSLELDQPPGAGPAWLFSAKGTSRTIYMENFPAGGAYRISANALSGGGTILCATTFQFQKTATSLPAKKDNSEGGPACIKIGVAVTNCP